MPMKNLFHFCTILYLLTASFFPCSVFAEKLAISATGQELFRQLQFEADEQGMNLTDMEFVVTTPVNLDNLNHTSPLARVTAENMSLWLVRQGFKVREIRRSDTLQIIPGQGEIVLTRTPEFLHTTSTAGALLVTGTYTVQNDNVLFHIRVLEADSNVILAMAPLDLPRTPDTDLLLTRNDKRGRTSLFAPSVKTSLAAY
jgi:hypothetical protein